MSVQVRSADPEPGWTTVRFGDVVKNANLSERDPESAGIDRVVGLEHLDPENLHVRRWDDLEHGTSFTRKFVPRQTLFGKRRAYQRKVAFAEFEGICSGDILTFEPKDPNVLLPELLPFICQTDAFFDHALGTSAGSLSPRTSYKALQDFEFPLPPIDEQKRIAEILWAADQTVECNKKALTVTKQVLNSTVNEFAREYSRTHDLVHLNDVIERSRPITYGILKPGLQFPEGIPVIKVKNFPSGVVSQEDILLTDPAIEAPYRRSRLKAGDLLISIRGTIGRLAEVPESLEGANITQDTARLSIASEVNKTYMRALLESFFVQKQIRVRTTGLAVQGINIGELRQLRIPVPSREVQDKVAKRYESTLQYLRGQEVHVRSTIGVQVALLRTLVGDGIGIV